MTTARCEECDQTVETTASGPAPALLLVLGAHSGQHKAPHKLSAQEAIGGPHTLLLRCLAPSCRSRPTEVVVQTSEAMAAVHALCFHSYHEGHTLRIEWDGVVIHDAWADREGRPTEPPTWNPTG